MAYKLDKIDLALIDGSDRTFHITASTEIDGLKSSMADAGLMIPPLIVEKKATGRYTIISGFRRIAAAAALGWPSIQVRVLDPSAPAIDRVKFAIAENSFQRQLTVIEQCRSIQLMSSFFTSEKKMARAAGDLGLPANVSMHRKLMRLSTLPEKVQDSVLANTLSFAVAIGFEKGDPADMVCISGLFDVMKPSLNKQREIVTLLSEISIIEDISISRIVNGKSIQAIMTADGVDRSQKTEKVRACLRRRRFPEITRAEQDFENKTKSLKLDSNTRLLPPRSFEGTTYRLTFNFRNAEELEDRQSMMNKIVKNPVIRDILS